jgi:hypothetical protein
MRAGTLRLDLSTHEFLTKPEIVPNERGQLSSADQTAIQSGDHIVRDGHVDSHWVKGGGHNGGRPLRIARDEYSGKMFIRVSEHLPNDLTTGKLEQLKNDLEKAKPYHVPGEGFWLPLEECFPNHPHVALYNAA